jgi:hypothetical protein
MNFSSEKVNWDLFLQRVKEMSARKWIFRGQSYKESTENSDGEPIMSSFERALNSYGIDLSEAPTIEEKMIRDFRRKYEGSDSETVFQDSFYCLSLMQHHYCPTRLLDFTYSPYVAAFFAVENMSLEKGKERSAFVYCFNHDWINKSAREEIKDSNLFDMRFDDKTMIDESFIPLYMSENRKRFILADNPLRLHKRLIIQRGVFVIQGDISLSMMKNIENMEGWQSKENIIKFKLIINTEEELGKAYEDLRLMNITHESLFPGLDGFAKSLKQNLYLYRDLPDIKAKLREKN